MKKDETSLGLISCKSLRGKLQPVSIGKLGCKFCLKSAPMQAAAAAAKSLLSCPTLCDPIDGSPPGSPVPGILQARTLEWVAISFSNAWKWKVKVKLLSHVCLLATPWTAAYQAPPSTGFSRQEYWSGVPLPSPQCRLGRWDFTLPLAPPSHPSTNTQLVPPSPHIRSSKDKSKVTLEAKDSKAQETVTSENV